MEQQIVNYSAQTDPTRQSEALFLARLEVEEQRRFVGRLTVGLTVLLLLWLVGIWYFKQSSFVHIQSVAPKAADARVETAEVDQLHQELTRLKQLLGKAVTEALSVKLAALEDRIRMGQVGLQDLELIQSIKEDINLIAARDERRSYVNLPQELVPAPEVALQERFSRLETLAYLSFGTVALIILAAGSYFVRCGILLKRLETDLSCLHHQLSAQRRSA